MCTPVSPARLLFIPGKEKNPAAKVLRRQGLAVMAQCWFLSSRPEPDQIHYFLLMGVGESPISQGENTQDHKYDS